MLTIKQKLEISRIFAIAKDEADYDRRLKVLGVTTPPDVAEASLLIYAIATNKPVPKSND